MEPNYRRFYDRLRTKFPFIERELNRPGQIKSPSEIPELYAKFKKVTAVDDYAIRKNQDDSLFIFVSVIALMGDQFYFDGDAPLKKGFRAEMARQLNCDPTIISHALRRAKNYADIYPEFMERIDNYFTKMVEE